MTYQPDPALVRRLARKIVSIEAQVIRDLSLVDIAEELEDEFTAALGEDHADADWDAARAAAWDAARAAAWDAAWDALTPTVAELQDSAIDLYARMIRVGK